MQGLSRCIYDAFAIHHATTFQGYTLEYPTIRRKSTNMQVAPELGYLVSIQRTYTSEQCGAQYGNPYRYICIVAATINRTVLPHSCIIIIIHSFIYIRSPFLITPYYYLCTTLPNSEYYFSSSLITSPEMIKYFNHRERRRVLPESL